MPSVLRELKKPRREQMFVRKGQAPVVVSEVMAGMKPGESRAGFLGEGNILRQPDTLPETETLDAEGLERKHILLEFLNKWLTPNELSTRSNPALDRKSMVGKLKRRMLKELEAFLPARIKRMKNERLAAFLKDEELTIEEQSEIQDTYKNISP